MQQYRVSVSALLVALLHLAALTAVCAGDPGLHISAHAVTASAAGAPQPRSAGAGAKQPCTQAASVQQQCCPHEEQQQQQQQQQQQHIASAQQPAWQFPTLARLEDEPESTRTLPHPLSKLRTDIFTDSAINKQQPQLQLGACLKSQRVPVPRFSLVSEDNTEGKISTQLHTVTHIEHVQVPQQLQSTLIRSVKQHAVSQLAKLDSSFASALEAGGAVQAAGGSSGGAFRRPAGTAGLEELALLQARLQESSSGSNIQQKALEVLLTGEGVARKRYPPTNWAPPNDTPDTFGSPTTNYTGPYAMEVIESGWFGANSNRTKCPSNYPKEAPRDICAHVSLIELDAPMAYKQAMAWRATGKHQYAANALSIIDSWSKTNKELGLLYENGPLMSGWATAAMARALELLRGAPDWQSHYDSYVSWTRNVTLPSMDFYIDTITAYADAHGVNYFHGNWHSTIAEAWMAFALLTDDAPRFERAVHLFNTTVHSYLRWGKGNWTANGRALGECSETLRDTYHSEFGLGGLLQVAEMAWQQDIDLYSTADYALVAAMELHARILTAGRNGSLLPPGFKFVESMPQPPEGTSWKFNIRTQTWWAHKLSDQQQTSTELQDGVKYILGVYWLPTGWELGYNHYAGRLGIPMPETAKLLAAHPIDHFYFHWGLSTLTHADSAMHLWRPGLQPSVLCGTV